MRARASHPKPPRTRGLNEAWAGNILPFPRKSPDFFPPPLLPTTVLPVCLLCRFNSSVSLCSSHRLAYVHPFVCLSFSSFPPTLRFRSTGGIFLLLSLFHSVHACRFLHRANENVRLFTASLGYANFYRSRLILPKAACTRLLGRCLRSCTNVNVFRSRVLFNEATVLN